MPTAEYKCDFCGVAIIRNIGVSERHYCDLNCKSEWQRLAKPVSKAWLEEHYLVKKMDCTQIAHIVDRAPKSVWCWLVGLGIPRRGRGFASTRPFVKGQASPFKGHVHTPELRESMRAQRKADGRVPYLKNGQHWMKETGQKPASWRGGITPERQAFYATDEWKECVKAVWARDNAICQRCGLDHRTVVRGVVRFDLHHVDGFKIVKRRADPGNVILLCQPCHKWIHSKKNIKGKFLGKGH